MKIHQRLYDNVKTALKEPLKFSSNMVSLAPDILCLLMFFST